MNDTELYKGLLSTIVSAKEASEVGKHLERKKAEEIRKERWRNIEQGLREKAESEKHKAELQRYIEKEKVEAKRYQEQVGLQKTQIEDAKRMNRNNIILTVAIALATALVTHYFSRS